MLDKNHIKTLFKVFLQREPENDHVVDEFQKRHKNLSSITKRLLDSKEFKNVFLAENIPEKVIVYIHIPKAAGTFLRTAWLKNNIKNYFWTDEQHNKPFFRNLQKSYIEASRYELIGGHKPISTFLKLPIIQPRVFLNVLREPIPRILSFYNHVKNNDVNHGFHQQANENTLFELLQKKGDFYNTIFNQQLRYLIADEESIVNFSDRDTMIIGKQEHINLFIEKANSILNFKLGMKQEFQSNKSKENYLLEIEGQKDFDRAIEILKEITKKEYKLYNDLESIKVMDKNEYLNFTKKYI